MIICRWQKKDIKHNLYSYNELWITKILLIKKIVINDKKLTKNYRKHSFLISLIQLSKISNKSHIKQGMRDVWT